jgi:hypothetical protein
MMFLENPLDPRDPNGMLRRVFQYWQIQDTTSIDPSLKTPQGQEEIEGLERLLMDRAAALPDGAAGRGGGPEELLVLPIYAALPPEQQMRVRAPRAAAAHACASGLLHTAWITCWAKPMPGIPLSRYQTKCSHQQRERPLYSCVNCLHAVPARAVKSWSNLVKRATAGV